MAFATRKIMKNLVFPMAVPNAAGQQPSRTQGASRRWRYGVHWRSAAASARHRQQLGGRPAETHRRRGEQRGESGNADGEFLMYIYIVYMNLYEYI